MTPLRADDDAAGFEGGLAADGVPAGGQRRGGEGEEVLGVREEYLDAALEVVGAEYGSLPNYLAALGVTEEQVTRLQTVLRG